VLICVDDLIVTGINPVVVAANLKRVLY